ncbi:Probable acetyl-CoA acyltransferase [Fusobacterium necrophorum subsp. necrophorum]|nr:Probable acetyl-CoA acyltransferase [Fusobacterium necrophorum subsp. necrophorum]
MKPAFKKDGSVTAGNASGLNDGASIVLMASEEAVKEHNLTPLVEVVGVGTVVSRSIDYGYGTGSGNSKSFKTCKFIIKRY